MTAANAAQECAAIFHLPMILLRIPVRPARCYLLSPPAYCGNPGLL
jgi:hypothetical protein